MRPDAYFSNFHKWAFTPKSATFLYLGHEFLKIVKHVVTGRNHGEGPSKEFYETGTRDMTSILCVSEGLKYLESLGVERARQYCHQLVLAGAKRVA
jgi:selenocysteine lyase/cysteine desulfurase